MSARVAAVARAYDDIAASYDELTREDRWMRRVLWSRYRRAFRPGERILDLGCGTGQDTLWLAARGLRVVALDPSAGMLARLDRAARRAGLAERIELRQADAAALGGWPEGELDGIVSAFAVVNTVADPAALARDAARLLRPRGRMILHLLAPRGGGRGEAAGGQLVRISGHPVPHRLWPAGRLYADCFAGRFRCRRRYGLGLLWPQRWGRWLPPGLAYGLGRLEPGLTRLPGLAGRGRFEVLELERRPG